MGGGLINLASYAIKDIFLTGTPQITYYKSVYRRYTHFAMESIVLNFDKVLKFGELSQMTIPKNGDLIHKSYLHIILPQINITKIDVGIDTSILANSLIPNSNYKYIDLKVCYMQIMTQMYSIIYADTLAINVSFEELVDNINLYYNSTTQNGSIEAESNIISEIITYYQNENENYKELDIYYLTQNFYENRYTELFNMYSAQNPLLTSQEIINLIKKYFFDNIIKKGIIECINLQKKYRQDYLDIEKKNAIITDSNIKCAWVKNLGHSIIDYIEVFIGGQSIDKHLGIWINIWYQLTYKQSQIDIYDKLIGNVPELTDFNNTTKPQYDLYIPMSFWFNKFNGLSFPLIASQYNDVRIDVKLRNFEDVFYTERIFSSTINTTQSINLTAEMIDFIKNNTQFNLQNTQIISNNLTNIWNSKYLNLNGDIWMDYVYLDHLERKRFAQSGHEYLVEIIQTRTQDHFNTNTDLYFICPSKEIIWNITHNKYTQNRNGYTECKWYNYNINNTNPIINTQIFFNNKDRASQQNGDYYDRYQPYTYHKISPSKGINLYSFSLEPLQMQPTGSCNFSKLTDVRLSMNINEQCYTYTDNEIYSYDANIDILITIFKDELLNLIDMTTAKNFIKNYNDIKLNYSLPNENLEEKYNGALITISTFDNLTKNESIEILLSDYRKIFLKTNVDFYCFSLSLNILRIIGGYCSLAYSSKN